MMPGTAQRRSCDYRRFGTTDLYAALDAASGKVLTQMGTRHRSEEFRKFLNLIDKEVPARTDFRDGLAHTIEWYRANRAAAESRRT